jgi:hypothetical protein
MIVAIPIILWRLFFLKSNTGQYHDKKGMEIAIKERLTADVV